jgi:4-amino-4-deoxychorismate lyase
MILVNGTPAESIPATDRGFAYGDGVFRTLRAVNGEPLHWRKQFNKLADDCVRLGITCPPATALLAEVRTVAEAQGTQAVVKVIITRGSGARGYATRGRLAPLRAVGGSPLTRVPHAHEGIRAHLCRLRLSHQPALAGVKHLNRLENVLARAEWHDEQIREGLLLDQQGLAIGGTMSNLFVVEGKKLITPQLDQCGVAGVTRARVIAHAERLAIVCRVEPVPLQRLLEADEVFFVNSLIGVWPMAQLDKRTWSPGPMARDIRHALAAEDAALA